VTVVGGAMTLFPFVADVLTLLIVPNMMDVWGVRAKNFSRALSQPLAPRLCLGTQGHEARPRFTPSRLLALLARVRPSLASLHSQAEPGNKKNFGFYPE
jgi:hypothetical protein